MTVLTLGKSSSAANKTSAPLLYALTGAEVRFVRFPISEKKKPQHKQGKGSNHLHFILIPCMWLTLTGLFLQPSPPRNRPLHPLVSPLLLRNCFSPVFLLMLRGLWTAASSFTLHSVASLRAAQIFIGTRPHGEYWWKLLCTLWTGSDVSSWARPGPGIQCVNCVMALAVKNGYRAAGGTSYVISFQCLMDTTVKHKDFYIQRKVISGGRLPCSL